MRILITGGAGFVGASLARAFRQEKKEHEVWVLDNLKRRGSELNVALLNQQDVHFVHGDIRVPSDLQALPGEFDLFIEASAEPSVLSGLKDSPEYLLQTNVTGTLNCLEFSRARAKRFIFLSTSRVYSIQALRDIALQESPTRFEIKSGQTLPGVSPQGIDESFTTQLPRSLYGASKLASELFVQEYGDTYGMAVLINRCGVIAGPGQFGKVDQGVFTLWVANHYFKKPLTYTGFGGTGKQVRDLLHPGDLYDLIQLQLSQFEKLRGQTYNVGGGREISTSLQELTTLCQSVIGNKIDIESRSDSSSVDIPLYLSDCRKVSNALGWKPHRNTETIVRDIVRWIRENEMQLKPLFQA